MINYYVHETSIVDPGAKVGAGTKIWHFSHVSSGSKIGENVVLGQNVFVSSDAIIGNNCKIQNNVSVYDRVQLEDNVFIGPSAVFTNVINPRAFVERKYEYKQTLICEGASIGANATVVCGATIGSYALIGAGAVVNNDVPSFGVVVGVPARQIGWVDKFGERLEFDSCGKAFNDVIRNGHRYRFQNDRVSIVKV